MSENQITESEQNDYLRSVCKVFNGRMPDVYLTEPRQVNVSDLEELNRFITGTISLIKAGSFREAKSSTAHCAPFDLILGGKWGIKKLK